MSALLWPPATSPKAARNSRGQLPALQTRSIPAGVSITRLDRTARRDALVLYRITVDGDDHLLYPDEIQSQFGIREADLPAVCA